MSNMVRDVRQKNNMRLRDMHQLTGISMRLLSGIETGKHVPNVDYARRIAKALNTTVEALFPGSATNEQPATSELTA